jgi:hypothetical protein
MTPYEWGRHVATCELGLEKTALTQVGVSHRKDPFSEIHRRLSQAFRIKTPKFDMNAQLKRMMNNPFKQPTLMQAGKMRPLRI